MSNIRIIARLDIKGSNLIKSVQLEGLRIMGDPQTYALNYYAAGVDEILYIDCVASLYGRNHLSELIQQTAKNVYVPITVGGGIRNIDDVKNILRSGADKVAINTAAIKRPELIKEVATRFGSQCMVLSIAAKSVFPNKWLALTDNAREQAGYDVIEWAQMGEEYGAGEILLTSVDREGTRSGFDLELVKAVTKAVKIPVVASGGMGNLDHFSEVIMQGNADAVAIADALHYNRFSLQEIRQHALNKGIEVRKV